MIVVWQVTEHCNYRCGFCRYDQRQALARRQASADELLRLGTLLAQWQCASGERVLLSFLGGEPLLWPPLFTVAASLRARGLALSLTSNGSTLGSATVRTALLRDFAELTFSVDGFAERHETLRACPGSWRALRQAIKSLVLQRSEGAPLIRINSVLMRSTIAEFPALCRELAGWGVDQISFNQLGGRDRPEFFPAERLLPQQIDTLCAELSGLRDELADAGCQLLGDGRYLERFAASARDIALPVLDCQPGERFLFIDAEQRLAPCAFSGDELGVPLTALQSLNDLQQLPARFHTARARNRPAACNDCPSTQIFAKFGSQT